MTTWKIGRKHELRYQAVLMRSRNLDLNFNLFPKSHFVSLKHCKLSKVKCSLSVVKLRIAKPKHFSTTIIEELPVSLRNNLRGNEAIKQITGRERLYLK